MCSPLETTCEAGGSSTDMKIASVGGEHERYGAIGPATGKGAERVTTARPVVARAASQAYQPKSNTGVTFTPLRVTTVVVSITPTVDAAMSDVSGTSPRLLTATGLETTRPSASASRASS